MNPSAKGWIKKLLKELATNESFLQLPLNEFYSALKASGFIYGSNISVVQKCTANEDFTHEELCRINLFLSFYFIYNKSNKTQPFLDSVINFYNTIDNYKSSYFEDLLGKKKSENLLEAIIHKRVYIDDNIITKNFNYFITNALLFVDVLAYQKYLNSDTITKSYLIELEAAIETIVLIVFDTKKDITKYDESLIKLLESSIRYQNKDSVTYQDVINSIHTELAKYYIIDIACMAYWSDKIIDTEEQKRLISFGKDLKLHPQIIVQSIEDINTFYNLNKDKIALLSSKNMIQSFYENSSNMVTKLIKRNSKRLLNELRESKELMVLLTQSTKRALTEDEQKKVQDQLLDIMKSIPSLAIFMLPGGAILLPLFVKFIPKLLPSAFDENRIEE
ncbi:LETM1-related biofilm-associated protein [Yeosuana sp.]|uniref:LETM1-related biofilm-associated protein n=1 Tax=Yeosuana sp. TaxID=2529388 RepID=UPI0040550AE1|tara:strand:- start:7670 stop:8842 length:1173 start_codon:yes stop_codon:yes gene_type:complete